jgi:hypothetical protein
MSGTISSTDQAASSAGFRTAFRKIESTHSMYLCRAMMPVVPALGHGLRGRRAAGVQQRGAKWF